MSHTDPYSPPLASLDGLTPSQKGELQYSGFWQRVGAALIDFVIVLPVIGMDYFFGGESRFFQLYMLIPSQLLVVFLHIYMVVKYGGTPGKLALGLYIAKLDGAPVTVKEAALRYSVLWILSLAMVAMTISAVLGMSDAEYMALSYMERSAAVGARAPYMMAVSVVMNLWIWGSVISVIVTKKRRALHDFVAGTVVLRK